MFVVSLIRRFVVSPISSRSTTVRLVVQFDFFDRAEGYFKTDKLLAILLSLPMVLLIWSTLIFAASMVTFAWFGVDTTFIDGGNGDNGGSCSGGSSGDSSFKFSKVTAGFATGFFGFLTIMVLNSVVYFWRVSTSHLCVGQAVATKSLSGMELQGQSQEFDQGGDTEMEGQSSIPQLTSVYILQFIHRFSDLVMLRRTIP